MKLLITGVSGFSGRHLVRYLQTVSPSPEILGTRYKSPEDPSLPCRSVACDLTSENDARSVIQSFDPDFVIHLSAQNRGDLGDLLRLNAAGTDTLLSAIEEYSPSARVLAVSSGSVYGSPGFSPVRESATLRPLSPYAVSKAAMEMTVRYHHMAHGLQCALVRPFNLIGPGQSNRFVLAKIVHQAGMIQRGETDALSLMNVISERDFVDVRDAVRAYWAIITCKDFGRACEKGPFNVGSGCPVSIQEAISLVSEMTGLVLPLRLPDPPLQDLIPTQAADISAIHSLCGWKPTIPLKRTIEDMLRSSGFFT